PRTPTGLTGRGVRFHNGDAFGAIVVTLPPSALAATWVADVFEGVVEFIAAIATPSEPIACARTGRGDGIAVSRQGHSLLGGSTRGIAGSSGMVPGLHLPGRRGGRLFRRDQCRDAPVC